MKPESLQDLTPDEVVRFMEIQRLLQGLDLDALEKERKARETPRERVLARLGMQASKKQMTQIKKRKPGRPKLHWKQKKRKHREYMRKYMAERYHEVAKPRRAAARKACLEGNDWYGYLMIGWRHHQKKVELTKEEWDRAIARRIGESIPVVLRYNANEPISLYNILVKDSDTRSVLFDGKEQALIDGGYVVPTA